ncbi:hypothetical protein GCM10008090_20040 [Arenicella chitinivorans]|uniref:DUF6265 domain-containing protein n=1 Tax=Arenicella chitinivorans TaxID=1329800 RepID=A0A918VND5_9GAMM|nr:DUF6265 family protein [Arenicella chitinivorans]GHA10429.1 hypothetical protein GCM10008090_20040 [Arenicella chitinivorans]
MRLAPTQILIMVVFLFWVAKACAADCHSMAALEWMQGDWVSETPKRSYHESWWRVSDHTFEGRSMVRRAGREVVSQESLRLLFMSGDVFYLAKVPENPLPIAFKLSVCGEKSATFTNPEHDFPQRIRYTRKPDHRLAVEVGTLEKTAFKIMFTQSRDSNPRK